MIRIGKVAWASVGTCGDPIGERRQTMPNRRVAWAPGAVGEGLGWGHSVGRMRAVFQRAGMEQRQCRFQKAPMEEDVSGCGGTGKGDGKGRDSGAGTWGERDRDVGRTEQAVQRTGQAGTIKQAGGTSRWQTFSARFPRCPVRPASTVHGARTRSRHLGDRPTTRSPRLSDRKLWF
jgi:hypothetical protein